MLHALTTFLCCGLARNDERPTSTVKINGTVVRTLFDTGADLTVAGYDTYKKLKRKSRLIPYNNVLTAANGQEIESAGVASLHYQLGNYEFEHDTVILKGLKTEAIIGVDLMQKHNIVLDMGRRKILRQPPITQGAKMEPKFSPCTCPADMWICQCAASDMKLPHNSIGVAKKNMVLEPLQASVVEVDTPEGTLIDDTFLASGLHVPQGITSCNNTGKAKILVANANVIPIQIRRGDKLCTLEKVDKKEVVTNDEWIKRLEDRVANLGEGKEAYNYNSSNLPLKDEDIQKSIVEVPEKYRSIFVKLIKRFTDVFSSDPDSVGCCTHPDYKQTIRLIDPNRIANQPPYRVPPNLAHLIETYVLKLLKQGVIEPSTSPWSSPILLIKKPGVQIDPNNLMKSYRIAHNYRLLNANTHSEKWPLNSCFSLLDKVASGNVMSTVDVASGFWNQMLDEQSKKYTAFSIPSLGHFQYTRSSQGLKNSSPSFQRLLDFVISGIPDCHVFVDDIIISSKDMTSHLKSLEQLFQRFRQHGLKCRVSKVKFGARNVKYLGWEISADSGLRPGDLKTKAILEYKEPTNLTQLKGFLGLCNFFRKCVPFFSHIAKPLTLLTRKDSIWQGGSLPEQAKASFEKLKTILSSKPCLKPIDFNKDFLVTIDSSAFGTGCVLSQLHGNTEHPNLYLSKTNPDCAVKRSAFQIEADGIIWSMRQLKPLIAGGCVTIRTDHKPLASLDRTSSPMLDRVYAELEDFNFKMAFLPGNKMLSDGLSRQSDHKNCLLCKGQPAAPAEVNSLVVSKWADVAGTIERSAVPDKNRTQNNELFVLDLTETATNGKLLMITDEQIVEQQKYDNYIKAVVCYLLYNKLPHKPDLRNWVLQVSPYAEIRNKMVGVWHQNVYKILAPLTLRSTLLQLAHDSQIGGHGNWTKTLHKLNGWCWPHMEAEVRMYCQSCNVCQRNNPPINGYTKMGLEKMKLATKFGDRLHLDLLGPLVTSGTEGYKYCLVATDAFSSYCKIIPLSSKHASEVAKAVMTGWISHFAVPLTITSDQGSEFSATIFKELCKILGCELVFSSIEHPQSNGMAERTIRNILSYIRKFIEGNPESWSSLISSMMSALNTSVHTDKLKTPFELVFGYPPVLPSSYAASKYNYDAGGFHQLIWNHFRLQQEVLRNQNKAFERNKAYYDQKVNEQKFEVGDIVYLKAPSRTMKMLDKFVGPLKVIAVRDHSNLHLQHLETGKSYFAHSNRVKMGRHRQQLFHSTDTRFQGYDAKEENDVTKGNAQKAELATPVLQATGLEGEELADDLRRNLNAKVKGNDEAVDADDVTTNANEEHLVKGASYDKEAETAKSAKFYGPMTRARKKLLGGQHMEQVLNTIELWQGRYKNTMSQQF